MAGTLRPNDVSEIAYELAPVADKLRTILDMLGIPDSCSRMIAFMQVLAAPTTVDDLVKQFGFSRSTISKCMNLAERLGLVVKSRIGRKYIYEVNSKWSRTAAAVLREILEKGLLPAIEILKVKASESRSDQVKRRASELLSELTAVAEAIKRVVEGWGYG